MGLSANLQIEEEHYKQIYNFNEGTPGDYILYYIKNVLIEEKKGSYAARVYDKDVQFTFSCYSSKYKKKIRFIKKNNLININII